MGTLSDIGAEAVFAVESAFADVEYLELEYSLADCAFADMWNWMPNDCRFFDDIEIDPAGSVFRKYWASSYDDDDETKRAIEYQIRNKVILKKSDSWKSVDAAYLRRYFDGIFFLSNKGFFHYLAAWMTLYMKKKIDSNAAISRYFFSWFSENPIETKTWFLGLDKDKKAAIVKFLLYASSADHDPEGARLAKEALSSERFGPVNPTV